ncbi:hypothetical protein NC653_017694 [Populus alba x Populus x berolinensis]|uniref:Ammonium transporter AmtB-like domain-containing protein n=1 Tax=Populus alba x Populus x berolinensis TaxID=444605 RepID=A0AAD6QQY8_9ROSI|nr:hypothetical protein NC653_017692 [Populus alba x Populus x berolinensis]KAJ6994988.1 hypothetical protein NC653_017694 [Populus alba x Populus x berolinensis]
MAVLHTHAIAGSHGGILTGLFAKPNLNRLFFGDSAHYIGLFYGFDDKSRIFRSGVRQMGVQFAGIMFVVFVNVLTTTIICLSIQMVVPLRMSDEDTEIGGGDASSW